MYAILRLFRRHEIFNYMLTVKASTASIERRPTLALLPVISVLM